MDNKPGYLTTEFYVSILTSIGAVISAMAGGLPPSVAAKVAMVAAGAYALSRAIAKVGPAVFTVLAALGQLRDDVAKAAILTSPPPPPAASAAVRATSVAIIAALIMPFGFTSCAEGPVYPGSAVAKVGTDFTVAATLAMQAYANYSSGNGDFLWALSQGANAYQDVVSTANDVKALAKVWTGNTGDSQKLADKLARVFAASPQPPAEKTAAIAEIAQTVAAKASP